MILPMAASLSSLVSVLALLAATSGAELTSNGKRQVSWLKWWSYDGISGPEFWAINKRWRLCNEGRRQSPIELSTQRLVYDHLLSPLRLTWLDAAGSPEAGVSNKTPHQQNRASFELANEGRGIELWLKDNLIALNDSSSWSSDDSSIQGRSLINEQPSSWLLEGGPLSYSYRLFKIELHLASTGSGSRQTMMQNPLDQRATSSQPDIKSAEETLSEWLKSSKGSEHLIDGRDFDGELQLHFYNSAQAGSLTEVRRILEGDSDRHEPNMFASIGILLDKINNFNKNNNNESSSSSSSDGIIRDTANDPMRLPMDAFLDELQIAQQSRGDQLKSNSINDNSIQQNQRQAKSEPKRGPEVSFDRALLNSLVTSKHEYVTYSGSLNRPPCSENVDWIILNRALRVSGSRLDQLTGLAEGPLANAMPWNQDNVRPVKPRYGRSLRASMNVVFPVHPKQQQQQLQLQHQQLPDHYVDHGKESQLKTAGDCRRQLAIGSHECLALKPSYAYQLTSKWLGDQSNHAPL